LLAGPDSLSWRRHWLLLFWLLLFFFVVILVLFIEKGKIVRIFLFAVGVPKLVVRHLRQEEVGVAGASGWALFSPC